MAFLQKRTSKGHPCHEVMQHAHEPCTFCTCRALLESGAAEWVYRNPVTAHTFRIKDSLIEYSGCRYHVTLAINMDRSELETYRFNSFVHYEAFVNECLIFAFAASDEPDESLNLMLQGASDSSRPVCKLSIYERVPAEHRFQSTYCWPPSSAGTKILPFDLEQYLSQQYPGRDSTEPLVLSSGQELQRHLPVFCDQASAGGDQSLLLVPLSPEGRHQRLPASGQRTAATTPLSFRASAGSAVPFHHHDHAAARFSPHYFQELQHVRPR